MRRHRQKLSTLRGDIGGTRREGHPAVNTETSSTPGLVALSAAIDISGTKLSCYPRRARVILSSHNLERVTLPLSRTWIYSGTFNSHHSGFESFSLFSLQYLQRPCRILLENIKSTFCELKNFKPDYSQVHQEFFTLEGGTRMTLFHAVATCRSTERRAVE